MHSLGLVLFRAAQVPGSVVFSEVDCCRTSAYREVFVAQSGDGPSEEAHDHGPKGRQHHLPCGAHGDAPSESGVLDVHLQGVTTRGG